MTVNFTVTVDLTGPELVAGAFLFVSCVALVVHSWTFWQMHRAGIRGPLHRTAAVRVACAVVYVLVGVNAIWGQWVPVTAGFGAFGATQLTWMFVGRRDVRQSRKERPVSITSGLTSTQIHNATVMVDTVRSAGLPKRAAVVVLETALVESGLRVYANPNVPESMSIPHEAEGTDHASVGLLQQQVPSWGTARDCMDPRQAVLKFLHGAGDNPGLLTLPDYRFKYVGHAGATSWTQIPTGAAAQAVQVSAFPDRYQQQESTATQLVDALWSDTTYSPTSEEDDMAAPFTVTHTIHPTTHANRYWVTGPAGPREITAAGAVSTAAFLGLKIVTVGEEFAVAALPAIQGAAK